MTDIPLRCEVVVVGTGYGGSIAASRLARAGRDVVVLERGRERHPGEFPDTLESAAEEMQVETDQRHVGSRSALYSMRVGEMSVFHGVGLGGTSLVNANVSLRPDARVFDDGRWPIEIREDLAGLEAGYRRAEAMLRPQAYPNDAPALSKLRALEKIAGERPFERTPINVTFRSGPNVVGVHQEACNGCGDCVTGCNVGAKNTLLMNYLPDAVGHGARIFTEVEVRSVARGDAGWTVHYQPLGIGRELFVAPPLTIEADVVVLGAGVLGSSEILFRSRALGLSMSNKLGHRFSGNGDVLAFAYDAAMPVNAVGAGRRPVDATSPPGPCITGVIWEHDRPGKDGEIVVEDGVIPGALSPLIPGAMVGLSLAEGPLSGGPTKTLRRAFQSAESLLRGSRYGAVKDSLTFLVMGVDDDEGRVTFDGERVNVTWPGVGTTSYYKKANARLREASDIIGAQMIPSPMWHRVFRDSLVTVHPLGGCVMADRAEDGVVDERARLYSSHSGTAVHDGLYVLDGSIIPRPLGVNPLLTISALSERCSELLARDRGWTIDWSEGPVTLPRRAPTTPGIEFSESMKGFFSTTSTETFESAERTGREADTPMDFVLLIAGDDVAAMVRDPGHRASATGTVSCSVLSAGPITVSDGVFRLFTVDPHRPETRLMRYELPLVTTEGRKFFFEGIKYVHTTSALEAWSETTTLYVTVYEGSSSGGAVVGRGVLHIALADFARQMRTMRVTNAPTEAIRLETMATFGEYFAGVLWSAYGGVLRGPTMLRRDAPTRRLRELTCGAPEVYPLVTDDGVGLRLSRYQGGSRGPVILVHGMGASSRLFSTDTVQVNLTEYLYSRGFDVWLLDWRGSPLLEASHTFFTGDTVAEFDYAPAQRVVRSVTGRDDLHWVVHCVGSITFFMSTMISRVSPASIVALQVATDPIPPLLTGVKVNLRTATLLRALGLRSLETDAYSDERFIERRMDDLLEWYPVPRGERCASAVCHRVSFLYGLCWQHQELSEATHEAIHEMFGTTNLDMMQHLSLVSRRRHLVSARGEDAYMPHLDRLAMPITLMHGMRSHVWKPSSTASTLERLVRAFGPAQHRRVTFATRGHLDPVIGESSHLDVYPALLNHLDRVGA